jgi:hypothetical protein
MKAPRRFAENTDVSAERSRSELDQLLGKFGATQRATYVDDDLGTAAVQFRMSGRMVRLEVKVARITSAPINRGGVSTADWIKARNEQLERSAWRRLVLVVKAKLELIADGGSTFDREFLADILLPDGRTVGKALTPTLDEAYSTGDMPRFLLGTGNG